MNVGVKAAISAVAVGALGWFAYANFDQTIDLDFGLFELHRVPLPLALYGAIVAGMLIMVGVGLKNDLDARRALGDEARGSAFEEDDLFEEAGSEVSRKS